MGGWMNYLEVAGQRLPACGRPELGEGWWRVRARNESPFTPGYVTCQVPRPALLSANAVCVCFLWQLPRVTKTSLLPAWERAQHASVMGRDDGIGGKIFSLVSASLQATGARAVPARMFFPSSGGCGYPSCRLCLRASLAPSALLLVPGRPVFPASAAAGTGLSGEKRCAAGPLASASVLSLPGWALLCWTGSMEHRALCCQSSRWAPCRLIAKDVLAAMCLHVGLVRGLPSCLLRGSSSSM